MDSRLGVSLKMSSYHRKELLEEFLDVRDSLKILFNAIIDEVWKHCHKLKDEVHTKSVDRQTQEGIGKRKVKKFGVKNKIIANKRAVKSKPQTTRIRNNSNKSN